jgi:hypothetical protein
MKPDLPEGSKPGYLERYTVLPVDPSQEAAVMGARSGESYVIQGPPGTGKSQTIANLLADFAARGKRVLFICEKRVALDVVFHRLAEAGLKDLTCLVHDTKDDKKSFITELKRMYEAWREQKGDLALSARRTKLVANIEGMIAELEAFSQAMMAPAVGTELPLRRVIDMAVARGATSPNLDAAVREVLPSLASFSKAREHIRDLESIAQARGMNDRAPAHALLRFINAEVGRRDRPVGFLSAAVPAARAGLDAIDALSRIPLPVDGAGELTIDGIAEQNRMAIALRNLAGSEKLHLLDRCHPERARFEESCARLLDRGTELDRREQAAVHWVTRLSADETEVALGIARRREGRWLSILHADWRRLKRRIRECHRGEVLSFVHLLERLAAEHTARAAHEKERKSKAATYGFDDLGVLTDLLAYASDKQRRSPAEAVMIERCIAHPEDAARTILAMAAERPALETAREQLDQVLQSYGRATTATLRTYLAGVETHLEAVGEFLPHLARLVGGAPEVADAWRHLGLGFDDLETATLLEGISRTYSAAPEVARFDGARLKALAERLESALAELRTLNAKFAIARCRKRFRENLAAVQRSSRSAAGSAVDDAYREGCRLLEHQFGLTRPSKTLRELLTGESGAVLRDLKPIWMMSPLSVADVLPFADDLFDAVIFDEASQVPVEDAVPSLYRARQTIIVGDEMQLPPTSFFAANRDGDDSLPDYIAYAVSADSLLTKAVTTLASTRLTWHYRSRHEALISFCNRAFYNGELNTVPGRMPLKAASEIVNAVPIQKRAHAQLASPLLDRPVSFHHVEKGVYREQQNQREAEYVAELLRSLLKKRTGKSIGIVAFSQPQAQAIEEAIAALAATDRVYANRIEEERDREVEGQVAGLFIKNLENVQGDERDIIIVSVGYAPGPDGKMRMNFGPINQSGGEKRLNVIFSRAKHHIAIVASISHDHITNDFNAGANTLKQYLRYAAAVSSGREDVMHRCLDGLGATRGTADGSTVHDAVAARIAAELEQQGMVAAHNVGYSTLRIDVAGRRPDEDGYARAYLVDSEEQYATTDVVERHVTRPAIFRAFGWEVEQVLGKDWVLRERQ